MQRRPVMQWLGQWLGAAPSLGWIARDAAAATSAVSPGRSLTFPRDFGAHPETRTEWWYVTGSLDLLEAANGPASRTGAADSAGAPAAAIAAGAANLVQPLYGFQVTFFRTRTDVPAAQGSRFAAGQLIFAHAALTDLGQRRLRHDQRIARSGFGIAAADEADTNLKLRGWHLSRSGTPAQSRYRAQVASDSGAFRLDLQLDTSQPVLLQGVAGYSRKGPNSAQASHYYSQPQLAAQGVLTLDGKAQAVRGRAWLDHEWSDSVLDAQAVGWDWIGMNLADGSALTAFRLRRADGSSLFAGGSFRTHGGTTRNFASDEVHFAPGRLWASPTSRASYPVEWRVDTPAGRFRVKARLDNQELDSRASTGAIYWEGLSDLLDAAGRRVGRGYLEMTGYAARLRL